MAGSTKTQVLKKIPCYGGSDGRTLQYFIPYFVTDRRFICSLPASELHSRFLRLFKQILDFYIGVEAEYITVNQGKFIGIAIRYKVRPLDEGDFCPGDFS